MSTAALTPADVEVWLTRCELPADARARGRALLRDTLSRHEPRVAPGGWRFTTGPHGRPELEAGQTALDLRFSVSRTPGLVAVAVALGRRIGIDVESTRRDLSAMLLAERFLAPVEARDVRARPASEQRSRLLRYWTLREAYGKALGLGLLLGADDVAFRLADDSHATVSPGARASAASAGDLPWRLWTWEATDDHVISVAAEASPSAEGSPPPPGALELHTRWVESPA